MRKLFMVLPVALIAVGGSTACATKSMVKTSVAGVNDKVDALGRSLEETQERTKKNEGKISEVDKKADAAGQSAQQAKNAAANASDAAAGARRAADDASGKVDAFDKANRRLVYEVVLNENQGNFAFGKTELPAAAKQKIDEMVKQLQQDPKNVYIEIEGHTDNVGPKAVNSKIGLERAQAVEKYLYDQYQVPLHKMNVISYGDEKPVAPNSTKAGRAQNRRVVIRVLA